MEKADPPETKLALPREASRPDRLHAVSLEALAQILSGNRIYLKTSRSRGRVPISVLPTLALRISASSRPPDIRAVAR